VWSQIARLEALPKELTVSGDPDTLLAQLQRSEKEAVEYMSRATVLQGEVDHYQETIKTMLKKHKKELAKLKG
jgi:hypothetical protein